MGQSALEQRQREAPHLAAEAPDERAGRDRREHAVAHERLRASRGSRWKAGQRSGWASTTRWPAAQQIAHDRVRRPLATAVNGGSSSSQGPPPRPRRVRARDGSISASCVIAISAPARSSSVDALARRSRRPARADAARDRARRRWGSASSRAASRRASASRRRAAARASASEPSIVAGPSSMPGQHVAVEVDHGCREQYAASRRQELCGVRSASHHLAGWTRR